MEIFEFAIKDCPPRLNPPLLFNKVIYKFRIESIKTYYEKYNENMDSFYFKNLMRMIKYTCEDLKIDFSDITITEAQIIMNDLLELAALIVYCDNKEELKSADKIIDKLFKDIIGSY